LSLKILLKFVIETDFNTDVDLHTLLIKDSYLCKLYCKNFNDYISYVKEKSKNWTQDIDLLPLNSCFSHTQNVQGRLEFLNTLINQNLWSLSDVQPIDFLYNILIVNSICEKDNLEFYEWVKRILKRSNNTDLEEKIFTLFSSKICKDQRSCKSLSIQAFESYLKVFLNLNQAKKKLKFSKIARENKLEISVFCTPEELLGFEILWKIIFESFSNDIMNKGIEIVHDIFTVTYF